MSVMVIIVILISPLNINLSYSNISVAEPMLPWLRRFIFKGLKLIAKPKECHKFELKSLGDSSIL